MRNYFYERPGGLIQTGFNTIQYYFRQDFVKDVCRVTLLATLLIVMALSILLVIMRPLPENSNLPLKENPEMTVNIEEGGRYESN